MADVAVSNVEPQSSPKTSVKKAKKQSGQPKAIHPTHAIMVNNAIQNLKERGGSSLQAIKKYISATYKIDAEKCSSYIKKYIKASVVSGTLVQTKGKGATGSFKLATTAVTKKKTTSAAAATTKPKTKKASTTAGKTTKTAATATKVAKEKKTAVAKKSSARKSATLEKRAAVTAKVAKPKSPSKAKKTTKSPTKKPKSPKPKTTKATKVMKKRTSPKKK